MSPSYFFDLWRVVYWCACARPEVLRRGFVGPSYSTLASLIRTLCAEVERLNRREVIGCPCSFLFVAVAAVCLQGTFRYINWLIRRTDVKIWLAYRRQRIAGHREQSRKEVRNDWRNEDGPRVLVCLPFRRESYVLFLSYGLQTPCFRYFPLFLTVTLFWRFTVPSFWPCLSFNCFVYILLQLYAYSSSFNPLRAELYLWFNFKDETVSLI
jgi:hypothetical protein